MSTDRMGDARDFLRNAGFGYPPASAWTPLTGGVSSDLWRVELADRSVCVKGALEKLRVADDWHAPVSRNSVEFAWLTFAARHRPGSVPRLLAHDRDAGFFAMEFLDPDRYFVWKAQLMAGQVDICFAAEVGTMLGVLHRESAREPAAATDFATDENFDQLRLRPYLGTAARRNPSVAAALRALADRTAATHLAVVHGDVSPKNILAGPDGPVFLDAECAWFGDPAFDLAFCLNHLLLKSVAFPGRADRLVAAARALVLAYLPQVTWESPAALERRAATLLPALLLARVDGSSPVEYLDPKAAASVRLAALDLLLDPASSFDELAPRVLVPGHRTAGSGPKSTQEESSMGNGYSMIDVDDGPEDI